MIPPVSEDPFVNDLYDQIREHLVEIFDNSPEDAQDIFAAFYQKNPQYDEDFYFEHGSFDIALRAQYEIILEKKASDADFAAWRKACVSVWSARGS